MERWLRRLSLTLVVVPWVTVTEPEQGIDPAAPWGHRSYPLMSGTEPKALS